MKRMRSLSKDALKELAKLPPDIQRKARGTINRFSTSGIASTDALEPISGTENLFLYRFDANYATVVSRDANSNAWIALNLGERETVLNWALERRCELNPRTGAIQVYAPNPSLPASLDPASGTAPETATRSETSPRLFAGIAEDDLFALGLPSAQLPFVRELATLDDLIRAQDAFSPDVYEPLYFLASGDSLAEVMAAYVAPPTKSRDFADSLANNAATRKSFYVPEDEKDLRRLLDEPLAQWRVFLHESQRRLAYNADFRGPVRVLGGAGTGKTVVAMHRAKFLAERLRDVPGGRILFTTFTKNLAEDIKENLRSICKPTELEKIDVVNVDAWVAGYLKRHRIATRLVYGGELENKWRKAIERADEEGFDLDFYMTEYERVVAANDAFSESLYATAPRVGRRTRLDRKKRRAVWKVFAEFQNVLLEDKVRDIHTATYECRRVLEAEQGANYDHIIVDETQDFTPSALRLLRALAGPEHDADMFLVGDAHQRIYKTVAPLSKCGINIRGRSKKLRVCYRTTEEVRRAAFSLLKGVSFDDLDDSFDNEESRSLVQGAKPIVKNFADPNDEKDYVLSQVNLLSRECENGAADICVVLRTVGLVEEWRTYFAERGVELYEVKSGAAEDRLRRGVRLATMHRVKGLEFQYVFVAAANAEVVPPFNDASPDVSEEDRIAEKSLLYVALTRARRNVYVTSSGRESEYLAVLNEEDGERD